MDSPEDLPQPEELAADPEVVEEPYISNKLAGPAEIKQQREVEPAE